MESVSAAGHAKPQDSSSEKQGFLMLYGSQTGQSEAIAKVRHAVRARVCVCLCVRLSDTNGHAMINFGQPWKAAVRTFFAVAKRMSGS
jgi:hypothetical protein